MTWSTTKTLPKGLRLFVVEDEALIAMALEDMLNDLGCTVVDVAGTVSQALSRIDAMADQVDGAILDVNVGGEKIYPVADALAQRSVPFIFATGYGRDGLDQAYRELPVVAKPVGRWDLASALSEICGPGAA